MAAAPQTLQIKKYSNRRLYDQTHGRHLTHTELYDLIVHGATVSVTDGSTGHDITNVVLAQVLLERDPVKLAAFPPAVMHQIIRASEQMLSSFTARYLGQMIDSYAAMQRQIESLVGRAPGGGAASLMGTPPLPSAILDWAMTMTRPGGAAPAQASDPAASGVSAAHDGDGDQEGVRALSERIDSLTSELAALKSGQKAPRGAKRTAGKKKPAGRSRK